MPIAGSMAKVLERQERQPMAIAVEFKPQPPRPRGGSVTADDAPSRLPLAEQQEDAAPAAAEDRRVSTPADGHAASRRDTEVAEGRTR